MIVTLAEETPVNESCEMADELRRDVGIALWPTVVNACWPDRRGLQRSPAQAAEEQRHELSAAAAEALLSASQFGAGRLDRQRMMLAVLDAGFDDLILLPRLPTARLALHDLTLLADAMLDDSTVLEGA